MNEEKKKQRLMRQKIVYRANVWKRESKNPIKIESSHATGRRWGFCFLYIDMKFKTIRLYILGFKTGNAPFRYPYSNAMKSQQVEKVHRIFLRNMPKNNAINV